MSAELLERLFPKLSAAGYQVTSPADPRYNCIAWAAGHDDRWWEPATGPGYYWPAGVPEEWTLAALVQVFETLGYMGCADGNPEPDYEKVALFAEEGEATHAARQLPDGRWTSKMGKQEDIIHTLAALHGGPYGLVVQFLRRPRSEPEENAGG
jgi:hypothetical protein